MAESFSKTDLGRIEILCMNGRADLGASGFVRADGSRGDEKGSPAGWGSFFHIEDRGRKRSPARRDKLSRRVRLKVVPP
jgi:hypothetical protein